MTSIPSTKAKEQETATVIFPGTAKKRRTKQDFTIISNEILRDPILSKGAKLALIMLLSYCWFEKKNCFPGQERLSKDLQKSIRTIRRYLMELQEKQYITIVRRGLGKTNLYRITLPANGTKPTAQEGTTVTCPDRPKVTAKTDEPKHTQVEADEALSNSAKGMLEAIRTDCHIASMTTRNTERETRECPSVSNKDTDTTQHTNPSPPNRAETTKIEHQPVRETGRQMQNLKRTDEIKRRPEPPRLAAPPLTQEDMDKRIRERLARERQQPRQTWQQQQSPLDGIIPPEHQQTLNRQFGTGTQHTTCRSKRQPVYEKLQIAIERISEELGDFKHISSNITHAENIRRESGADIEQFIVTLYEARAATKHAVTMGKIQKQDSSGQLVKMPYFYAVLQDKAGVPKATKKIYGEM